MLPEVGVNIGQDKIKLKILKNHELNFVKTKKRKAKYFLN